MANQRPKEWASAVLSRFESLLPLKCAQFTPSSRASLEKHKECLVNLSTAQFVTIVGGLANVLKSLALIRIYGERQVKNLYTSQLIVLETIEKCTTEQENQTNNLNETIIIKQLLPEVCEFIHRPLSDDPLLSQLHNAASRVLYCLSNNYFQDILSRISTRLHDLSLGTDDMAETNSNLDMIQHIHVDMNRITVILDDVTQRFKHLRKSHQISLLNNLEKAIWNWIHSYPSDLCALYFPDVAVGNEMQMLHLNFITEQDNIESNPPHLLQQYKSLLEQQIENNKNLSKAAECLYELVETYCDGSKRKTVVCWQLQIMLLVFSPEVIQQIEGLRKLTTATRNKQHNVLQREFFNTLQRSLLSRNSQSQENALFALTKMITATTYVPCLNDCALHKLMQQILPEVKNLYTNGSKPLRQYNHIFLTSFIASCLRLDDYNTLSSTFLQSTAPVYFKKCFVQALRWIVTQHRMFWWPEINSFISLGCSLRQLFIETTAKVAETSQIQTRQSSQSSLRGRVSLRRNHSLDERSSNVDLLFAMVQLITANQKIFLTNLGNGVQNTHANCWQFLRHLSSLVTPVHANVAWDLSLSAMAALLNLHKPEVAIQWNPESPSNTFWDISSTMLVTVCNDVLAEQMHSSAEVSSNTLKWLREILSYRISFLLHDKPIVTKKTKISNAERRVEATLFSHLWSSDMEVVLVALSCFHYLHEEIQVRYNMDDSLDIRPLPEYCQLYKDLANVTETVPASLSSVQDRIRSILKENTNISPASLEAWENTRLNWERRTNVLMNTNKVKTDGLYHNSTEGHRASMRKHIPHEQLVEWISMTGLLCASGGICATEADISCMTIELLNERKSSTSSVSSVTVATTTTNLSSPNLCVKAIEVKPVDPLTNLPSLSKPFEHMSLFVAKLLDLLSHHHLVKYSLEIKNAARNLLATSLHPSLYPLLFLQIKNFLKKMYDPLGQMLINGESTAFVDYLIFIMKNLLGNCPEQFASHLGEESLEGIILLLVRYVRHMPDSFCSVNMKVELCELITKMMLKRKDLFFLSEVKFRNKLVEYLTTWVMTSYDNQHSIPDDEKVLLRQLDTSSMKAVVMLLFDLPLQPDENDGGDVAKAKSELFLKYFTLFMKLLNGCSIRDQDTTRESNRQLVELREHTICAMSNLLSANIEQGFIHSAVLAYHEDFRTRSAYLEILTKILQQQGTKHFDALKESTLGDRFDHLVEIVTMMGDGGELPIANALANVVHIMHLDELARVFVTLFDARHILYQLLWNMFLKEVKFAENVHTLFRGNSLASKIMTFCFKVYGASYLHNLMEPLVAWSLGEDIVNLNFEVDAQRLKDDANLQQSRANLQRLTERFFSRIMTSTDKFPPQLKSVCHCIYQVVSQRFPESGTGAVAGAIFLRFLSPAIVSPSAFGLTEKKLPKNLERAFRLMCKIMQNIANHSLFTKEPHMKHFNDFVRARFDVCQQFFVQISSPESPSADSVSHTTPLISEANISALHRLLWNNQEKIGVYLSRSRDAKMVGRKPFDKMVTLLAYIGPPEYNRPALETRISGLSISSTEFEEMMTKRKAADTEEFRNMKSRNIFYQSGSSKMGYPVFYYIARRFKTDEMRQDLLMYYILLAVKPYQMRKFELIVDLTHIGPDNQFKRNLLPEWSNILPASTFRNLASVYLYNANSWFKEYIEYHDDIFAPLKGDARFRFIDHLDELTAFIEAGQQKIPLATSGLNEDVTAFYNAISNGNHKINIKIGAQAIQITSIDKCKVLGHNVSLNDIYFVNEIDDISMFAEQSSFRVKMASNNGHIVISHFEVDAIVKALCHIRTRWQLSRPESTLTHRKINASEVAGTLLNMALLNLGCSNPVVRSSGYNLLCAITNAFELQIEGRLCETSDLCIPANNTLFITSISLTLANTECSLTLELLEECITGFCNSNIELKNLCLEYMQPWLFNLSLYVKNIDANKVKRVKSILHRLIEVTIDEKFFYPSLQAKVWGSLGQMSDLIDIILDAFIVVSAKAGVGSQTAEIMADTSVALAANNMKLVSSRIISRLCDIVDKTALRPTPTLEKNRHWDDIAILARYLLMLSFNNNLDVTTHMPYLCHLVSLLLHTGPISLRASMHGLVVNMIHSLLTCKQMEFKTETQKVLQLSLTEFRLPKFYQLFGIMNVKSAANTAFQFENLLPSNDSNEEQEDEDGNISLTHLDIISDFMLEIVEACSNDIINCQWLNVWLQLTHKFAFQYNPSLQPRAIVVLGCISKKSTLRHLKQLLKIMTNSLESHADLMLYQATILCISRLQHAIVMDTSVLAMFFWAGICAMHLDDADSYAAGLRLVENTMHQLHVKNAFDSQGVASFLMSQRFKIEWQFKQMDQATGIAYEKHFHYAFVCQLLKGFRHSEQVVVAQTIRLLHFMLDLISYHRHCKKYFVNADNVPYLTALLPWSADVRKYCGTRIRSDIPLFSRSKTSSHNLLADDSSSLKSFRKDSESSQSQTANDSNDNGNDVFLGTRQLLKSTDDSDSSTSHEVKRKSGSTSSGQMIGELSRGHKPPSPCVGILFDEDIITDVEEQTLLLTILSSQIQYSNDDITMNVLYEYLAEASIAFVEVFPIVHSLLDQKIISLLRDCENLSVLSDVQMVIHNCLRADNNTHQMSYLQNIGFGGMWRYVGSFVKEPSLENTVHIANVISEIIETHFNEVMDLTPVSSQQSVNSALSDISNNSVDFHEEENVPSLSSGDAATSSSSIKVPGFKSKGPKLTISIMK